MDKFIKQHSKDFDILLPNAGHEERFAERLPAGSSTGRFRQIFRYAAVALVVAALSVTATLYWQNPASNDTSNVLPSDELEYFYKQSVLQCQSTVESIPMDPADRQLLLEEILAMDSVRAGIASEYSMSGNDPRVEQALIDYYERKISRLSQVLERLQEINQQKNKPTYENIVL